MENKLSTIKTWSEDDRPREKLTLKGAEALSNAELLAILINTGSKTKTAVDIAKEVMGIAQNNLKELGKLGLKEFTKISGVGPAKAITLLAALELGRRRSADDALVTFNATSVKEVGNYLQNLLQDYNVEVVAVLFLNQSNKLVAKEIISIGGISNTVVDPRIVIKKALEVNATGLILCHNHPSGSLKPSKADGEVTNKIKEACKLMDLTLIDHFIVSQTGYYSFSNDGLL
jgi:DNA repair protein RadC